MKINDNDLELLAEAQKAGLLSTDWDDEKHLIPDDEVFVRLTLAQRIQHAVLIVSFFTLVLTAIPLLFPDAWLIQKLFFFESSFWLRGIIHRIAGIMLIGLGIFQIGYVVVSPHGNSDLHKIIPTLKDGMDAIGLFLYNLGIRQEKPKFGKFNFVEKFEYWAVAWGIFIMALTGLMLWFQEAAVALFPIWVLDIVRIVHGFEAILAFLVIAIWHMYNVFFKPEIFPMNKVWLTGKISKKEMMEHHPLEYQAILEERRNRFETEKVKTILEEVRQQMIARKSVAAEDAMHEEHKEQEESATLIGN